MVLFGEHILNDSKLLSHAKLRIMCVLCPIHVVHAIFSCLYKWRLEESVQCVPLLFFTLLTEERALTELGTCCFRQASCLLSLWKPPDSAKHC